MKVVCNSSTLIALTRIGRLDILKKGTGSLIIPQAVYDELVIKGKSRPGASDIESAEWIVKIEVSGRETVERYHSVLELGESEAIALAREIQADLIILDDEKARRMALSEGLKVSGLLAFLIQEKEKNNIERLKPLLDQLRLKSFFLSEDLYYHILRKAGE